MTWILWALSIWGAAFVGFVIGVIGMALLAVSSDPSEKAPPLASVPDNPFREIAEARRDSGSDRQGRAG